MDFGSVTLRHRAPAHETWLHNGLEIVEGLDAESASLLGVSAPSNADKVREGGRGIFLKSGPDAIGICAGTLLLEELPLVLGNDCEALEVHVASIRSIDTSAVGDAAIRDQQFALGSMYAGPNMGGAPAKYWARGVLSRNYHHADLLPVDGMMPLLEAGGPIGLWPSASLLNHDFAKANIARVFLPGSSTLQVRAIRDLRPGEELLDNYMDLCSSHAERARHMNQQHGINEKRDDLDAPPKLLVEAADVVTKALSMQAHKGIEGGLSVLLPFWQRLSLWSEAGGASMKRYHDPALADFYCVFGQMLYEAQLPAMAIVEGWARAFELVCGREPFSCRSAMLAARLALEASRLVSMNAATGSSVHLSTKASLLPYATYLSVQDAEHWFQVAWKHWQVVFGGSCEPGGVFERQNPSLFEARYAGLDKADRSPMLPDTCAKPLGCIVGGAGGKLALASSDACKPLPRVVDQTRLKFCHTVQSPPQEAWDLFD